LLRISREKARRQVLDQLKYVETCVLARELCRLIRTHRGVLEKQTSIIAAVLSPRYAERLVVPKQVSYAPRLLKLC
jgi:hypothetical protein